MNLASWIILAIVVVALAFAVKATFFKGKKSKGGCCSCGDGDAMPVKPRGLSAQEEAQLRGCSGSCASCPAASGCSAVSKNAVLPIVKSLQK